MEDSLLTSSLVLQEVPLLDSNLHEPTLEDSLLDSSLREPILESPIISTDKSDYAPGETVRIQGSGFTPNTTVEIRIADDINDPGDDGEQDFYTPLLVTVDEYGYFTVEWMVPIDDNGSGGGVPDAANATLNMTATGTGVDGILGTTDDQVATTTFTDSASGYSLKWYAADPSFNKGSYLPSYTKLSPSTYLAEGFSYPTGRVDTLTTNPFNDAVAYASSFETNQLDAVTSLAPQYMALGQIVPFELEIKATNANNGIITFTSDWLTKTTSGDDFGFDPNYKIIAAFVDARDPGTVEIDSDPNTPGIQGNAKVDFFSSIIVDPNTNNERIQGTFQVSGIDNGENIIVEIWAVLKNTIPPNATGNVQTTLVSAQEGDSDPNTPGIQPGTKINTGAQTLPLLRVQEFFTSSADLSVVVSDSPDAGSKPANLTSGADVDPANLKPGDIFTYTILAKNNSTDTVANTVVLKDTLDNNITFISASNSGTWADNDANVGGGIVTWTLGALSPGESQLVTVTAQVNSNALTTSLSQDLLNTVAISSITNDSNSANNNNTEATNLVAPIEATQSVEPTGAFQVSSTGQVGIDYLFDGGSYQGELAIFSLAGMAQYTPGSVEFIQEAARRALTNTTQGRVLIRDGQEEAKFSTTLSWEVNYNGGNYQGVKYINMKPNDQVAFMLVQNNTIESVYNNPSNFDKIGQTPLFSLSNATPGGSPLQQIVAVDNKGTLAFEDQLVNSSSSDKDYNDVVFQVSGLNGEVPLMDSLVDTQRDFRNSSTGQELLTYTSRPIFTTGAFNVGETGKVQLDYLFDGGWFQGELALFNLRGMESFQPGSNAFIQEAARRAVTNSNQGYVLIKDLSEGAKFAEQMSWEKNFNSGSYKGIKTFAMEPGEQFAFMLVQNTTVQEIANDVSKISQWGKLPIFSIPEANPGGTPINQMVKVDNNGTYAFEDVRTDLGQSDKDYNDLVFQIKGASGSLVSVNQSYNSQRNWRTTSSGEDLLSYANRAVFDRGVFLTDSSGQISVDFYYDGGLEHGEVGLFSLAGMENLQIGSRQFIDTALQRALSDSTMGRVIVRDNLTGNDEAGKFTENLPWEGQYNYGQYLGKKILQLNPAETYGLVLVPDRTLQDELLNPSTNIYNKPLFSMSNANVNKVEQFGQMFSTADGMIVGFEDVHLNNGSNRDYNDIVLGFQGLSFLDVPNLDNLVHHSRQWQNMAIGQTIINDFVMTT